MATRTIDGDRPVRLALKDALEYILNGDESENDFGSEEDGSNDDFEFLPDSNDADNTAHDDDHNEQNDDDDDSSEAAAKCTRKQETAGFKTD